MNNMARKENREPIWVKIECDNGKRWTSVKNPIFGLYDGGKTGDWCSASGCKEYEHKITLIGETTDRTKAHDWFRF